MIIDKEAQNNIQLAGRLAEFRTALREEIEAATREAASAAVQLINGRRIAKIGQSFQYLFEVENALNMPGDAPGDLFVRGRGKLEVTIISVDGMAITLSVPADLGSVIPEASLQSNLAHLMRKLIERIEALAETDNVVGDRVLDPIHVHGEPEDVTLQGVNEHQAKAVASGLGRDITFIWGPPGTGKTTTIGAFAAELFWRERSVLLVSHTNAAVDAALLKIGERLDAESLASGAVVRVGDHKDQRLNDSDLLLSTHVERRLETLTQEHSKLEKERGEAEETVKHVARQIDILEWLDIAQRDIESMTVEIADLHSLKQRLDEAEQQLQSLELTSPEWIRAAAAARAAQQQTAKLEGLSGEKERALTRQRDLQVSHQRAEQSLPRARHLLQRAEAIEPLRTQRKRLPSPETQKLNLDRATDDLTAAGEAAEALSAKQVEAERLFQETTAVGKLTRLWRRLPEPEEQHQVIERVRVESDGAAQRLRTARESVHQANALLEQILQLDKQLSEASDVPEVAVQQGNVQKAEREADKLKAELEDVNHRLASLREHESSLAMKVSAFRMDFGDDPAPILQRADIHIRDLDRVRKSAETLKGEANNRTIQTEYLLGNRLQALRDWGFTSASPASAEQTLEAIKAARVCAAEEVEGLEVRRLRADRDRLNSRIVEIENRISAIEEAMKRVEEALIAGATVVATTLTRAYLRDAIQERRFDTVILDEASMAPIPALWVAASVADANAVVVGDPKQLPPIVLSEEKLAKKWLGRDVFEVAQVKDEDPCVILLQRQYRMQPAISAIPNHLIYRNKLEDDPLTEADGNLREWYHVDWEHDQPVLLVDTGSLGAWVTSVPRGRRSSRLNFLSATVCVDLAEGLLLPGRPPVPEGAPPRILIVSPYRPHARLLELLVREQGLSNEVRAGTAHTFQGAEADVVILDLVNDEPHWKVAMFISKYDDTIRRLLNVALTRARRRLIIVGNFKYIRKNGKKAFVGRDLIPFLHKRYQKVHALEIVPANLAARTAQAQVRILGGEVEPKASRIVVTQAHFDKYLRNDLTRAQSNVVIYSPFITQNRLSELAPQLKAMIERGVQVSVITKAHDDRKGEVSNYRRMEQALEDWGITVIHKKRMHEKLIFIDNEILWSGSLNPLSFRNTQEVMERRVSHAVASDFAQTLRLNDLLREYENGPPTCPICSSEMVASEGKDDPFYWRCVVKDCYTRSIDQPSLEGGVIRCRNCGGAVKYGEWGGKPAWRCVKNTRHRQRIARTHLRLPKMREIVPNRILRRLDKQFKLGIDDLPLDAAGNGSQLELELE